MFDTAYTLSFFSLLLIPIIKITTYQFSEVVSVFNLRFFDLVDDDFNAFRACILLIISISTLYFIVSFFEVFENTDLSGLRKKMNIAILILLFMLIFLFIDVLEYYVDHRPPTYYFYTYKYTFAWGFYWVILLFVIQGIKVKRL